VAQRAIGLGEIKFINIILNHAQVVHCHKR